jgi:hypothetical protein
VKLVVSDAHEGVKAADVRGDAASRLHHARGHDLDATPSEIALQFYDSPLPLQEHHLAFRTERNLGET